MNELKSLSEKFRGARITLELPKEEFDKIADELLGELKSCLDKNEIRTSLDTTEFIIQSQ